MDYHGLRREPSALAFRSRQRGGLPPISHCNPTPKTSSLARHQFQGSWTAGHLKSNVKRSWTASVYFGDTDVRVYFLGNPDATSPSPCRVGFKVCRRGAHNNRSRAKLATCGDCFGSKHLKPQGSGVVGPFLYLVRRGWGWSIPKHFLPS